jgi:hypothetical protein
MTMPNIQMMNIIQQSISRVSLGEVNIQSKAAADVPGEALLSIEYQGDAISDGPFKGEKEGRGESVGSRGSFASSS